MQYIDIRFPHPGIMIQHVGQDIYIGNFRIMYYGIVIALAFFCGYLLVSRLAVKSGENPDIYLDFLLCLMVPVIIGARIYYVIFSWDYYKAHPEQIINIRQGGLGIVGGVLTGIIVAIVFCKVRKQKPLRMMDALVPGLLLGQIIGRWGNFFNREAFGCFTDSFFAMQIPVEFFEKSGRLAEITNAGLVEKAVDVVINGTTTSCIQVHPTFLYEGLWNLCILLFVLYRRKRKAFDGEIVCLYLMGYGVGRFFIEGLRVDQLQIGSTGIAATQVVCIISVVISLIGMIYGKRKAA